MSTENKSDIGKVCIHCKQEKPLEAFGNKKDTRDRKQTWCKGCNAERLRQSRYDNPVIVRQKAAKAARLYRQTPTGKFATIRANAYHRDTEFCITIKDFKQWLQEIDGHCFYCGIVFSTNDNSRNMDGFTIDRKDGHTGYKLDNIVQACRQCNTIKGTWFTYEEMIEIGNKYLRRKIV